MALIGARGAAWSLYIRGHEGRAIGLTHKLRAYELQDRGRDTVEANVELGFAADPRDYGIGAQILFDLGVRTMRLLTNNPDEAGGPRGATASRSTSALPLETDPTPQNVGYLRAKREKLGHLLDLPSGRAAIERWKSEHDGVARRPDGAGRRVAVVVARFNEHRHRRSSSRGRSAGSARHGVADEDVDVAWVPGAFEIPLVARRLAATGAYDAVICLGAVIRGETAHFDLRGRRGGARASPTSPGRPGIPVDLRGPRHRGPEQAPRPGPAARTATRGGRPRRPRWRWPSCSTSSRPSAGQTENQSGREQAAMIVEKPWGKVVTYALNQPSSVRVITVEPGRRRASTTTRCAMRRGWCSTRASGSRSANRTVDAQARARSSWSPPRRRIASAATAAGPGRVLEVAYGYTTEDDTLRLQDAYGRPLEPDW